MRGLNKCIIKKYIKKTLEYNEMALVRFFKKQKNKKIFNIKRGQRSKFRNLNSSEGNFQK